MSQRIGPVIVLALLLTTLVPPTMAGQILGDCDVQAGQRIQPAIDAASPGARIVVCAGIYPEQLVVKKKGLTLEGRGAVLDGAILSGTRYGIRIAEGTEGVTVTGFEIRNYRNPLAADASSGIVSGGSRTTGNISGNHIHDNGWAGILVGSGSKGEWRIEANTFGAHGGAHVMVEGAQVQVRKNQLNDSRYGIVLTGVRKSVVADNFVTGSGAAAILVGPSLGGAGTSRNVVVTNNTVSGTWQHGLWTSVGGDIEVSRNQVQARSSTFGGSPELYRFSNNTIAAAFQVPVVPQVDEAFKHGAAKGFRAQADGVTFACGGLACLGWPLHRLLDALFPSARAQELELWAPYDCAVQASCTAADVRALLDHVTLTALNPMAVPEDADDLARLGLCKTLPDSCLTKQFILDGDAGARTSWNLTLAPGVELRFVEVAIRKPGGGRGARLVGSELDQAWTPLVLCRMYAQGKPGPCLSEPKAFDFGLDLDWNESAVDQHVARWRLRDPGSGVHATFQRVHGNDATLFKNTTRPHDASAPLLLPGGVTLPGALPEPTQTVWAGNLVLECSIRTTSVAPAGCGSPRVVRHAQAPTLQWCAGTRVTVDRSIHESLEHEATTLWPWSGTCQPVGATTTQTWSTMLTTGDREELADAHDAGDLDRAEAILTRMVARHLAATVPAEGLPRIVNATLLAQAVPSIVGRIPKSTWDAAAVWTGAEVFLIGGGGSDEIVRFDPATRTTTKLAARIPGSEGQSAFYDGQGTIYVFGGDTDNKVYAFDTTTHGVRRLEVPYPGKRSEVVWDGRDRPLQGCPGGCAYLFSVARGISNVPSSIYRFNPATEKITLLAAAFRHTELAAVAFDGENAYVLGGASGYNGWWTTYRDVIGFNTTTETVFETGHILPEGRILGGAYWDGRAVYWLGGETKAASGGGNRTQYVIRYDPRTGGSRYEPHILPRPSDRGAAVHTGQDAWVFGGHSESGAADEIVHYAPTLGDLSRAIGTEFRDFGVVDLTSGTPSANVRLQEVTLPDHRSPWMPVLEPGRTVLTPMAINVTVHYDTLAGETLSRALSVVVTGEEPRLAPPVLVEYGGELLVDLAAYDPDNAARAGDYRDASQMAERTIVLVNTSLEPDRAGIHMLSVEAPLATTSLQVCLRELWTADADGATSNAAPGTRLAVANESTLVCPTVATSLRERLQMKAPVSVSLEFRDGDMNRTSFEIVDDPYRTQLRQTDAGDRISLLAGAAVPLPGGIDASIQPTAIRLVVEVQRDLTPADKAYMLARTMQAVKGAVGVVAVEVDDLPLVPELADAVRESVQERSTIVLVGAGTLPDDEGQWDLAPVDKMMTIHGLAVHPLVLTIGAGDVASGVAPWSRLGPTPQLTPKPDFLAPSVEGTTGAAVANVLPFAEALVAQGFAEPNLVRALLAGYAVPVRSQAGTPAIYWEQGAGALDMGDYATLPDRATLLQLYAQRAGIPEVTAKARLAGALGTSVAAIDAAPSNALIGVAAPPAALLRTAIARSLLEVTIDAPAYPAQIVADFGVVNHNKTGTARFRPIDLDPILPAAANATKRLLLDAGYSTTDADTLAHRLAEVARLSAEEGQLVTIDSTHFYLFDFLTRDFVYTGARLLLDRQVNESPEVPGVSAEALQRERDRVAPWLLEPHHFTPTVTGVATTDVDMDECVYVSAAGTHALLNTAESIIEQELLTITSVTSGVEVPTDVATPYLPTIDGANQLACTAAQTEAIGAMRERAVEVRALKLRPLGAWSASEQDGSWEETGLGQQIGNTSSSMGLARDGIRQDATLVLDALIDALDRAEVLLTQKLAMTRPPNVDAYAGGGPKYLQTAVEATTDARLGPYVGIATMTSHGVQVYNPIDGSVVGTRDLTIPLPSLLWNNPTLVWRDTFRDGSPYRNKTISLHHGDGRVFDRFTADHTVEVTNPDGSKTRVHVGADANRIWDAQVEVFDEQIARLQEDLAACGDHETDAHRCAVLSEAQRAAIAGREVAQGLAEEYVGPLLPTYYMGAIDATFAKLYSHLTFQENVSDETGAAELSYLYPGRYIHTQLYPFGTRHELTSSTPLSMPGHGWFSGPVQQADDMVFGLGIESIDALPAHPTATQLPVRRPVSDFSVYEMQSPDAWGPFNSFDFHARGPDLLAIACMDMRAFSDAMGFDLRYPGCDAAYLPEPIQRDLDELRAYSECARNGTARGLDAGDGDDCRRLHSAFAKDDADCAAGRCLNQTYRDDLRAQINETVDALDALRPSDRLPVPWVRSPARMACLQPMAYGFTYEQMKDRTARMNPGQPSERIGDAINSTIDDLCRYVNESATIVPPWNRTVNATLAGAVLHHSTDNISGLDWAHAEASAKQPLATLNQSISNTAVRDYLATLPGLVADPVQSDRLRALVATLQTTPSDTAAAFRAALDPTPASLVEAYRGGWRANGTLLAGGLTAEAARPTRHVPKDECAATAAAFAGVPEGFVTCEGVTATTVPSVVGLGGVDNVSFVNALLELSRDDWPVLTGATPDRELAREILAQAVARSSGEPGRHVARTDQGILVNASSAGANMTGFLLYSAPLGVNEYIRYTLSAEFSMRNTGALVVTSANPIATEAIALALSNLTSPDETIDTVERVIAIADATYRELQPPHPKDPLVRYDVILAPTAVENRASFEPNGLEGHGLLTIDSANLVGYEKTNLFNTRLRGPFGGGPRYLDVIVVYFPLVDEADAAVPKFGLSRVNLTMDTFVGLNAGYDLEPRQWRLDNLRTGYRGNVENWTQWIAVPDQPLAAPGAPGLHMEYLVEGQPLPLDASRLTHLPPDLWRPLTDCPSLASPGFGHPQESPYGGSRGGDGKIAWAQRSSCPRVDAYGLEPRRTQGATMHNASYTEPGNDLDDALQYWYNTGDHEDFTYAVNETFDRRVSEYDDWQTLFAANPMPEIPIKRYVDLSKVLPIDLFLDDVLTRLERARGKATWALINHTANHAPVIRLHNATPFVQASFIWETQFPAITSEYDPNVQQLNNYYVVTGDDIKRLVGAQNTWEPLMEFDYRERTDGSADTPFRPTVPVLGEKPPELRQDKYRAGVIAYDYRASLRDGETSPYVLNVSAELLAVNGKTGSGTAWRVTAEEEHAPANELESFFADYRVSPPTVARVTGYALGGSRVAGRDCQEIPAYVLADAFYRCTGYQARATPKLTPTSTCNIVAKEFLDNVTKAAFRQAVAEGARQPFRPGSPETLALGKMTAPRPAAPPDAEGWAASASEAMRTQIELAMASAKLLVCAPAVDADANGEITTPIQDFDLGLDDAVRSGGNRSSGAHLANASLHFDPGILREPPRLLDLSVLADLVATALAMTGPLPVTGTMDQWSTNASVAWFNVTRTPVGGSPQLVNQTVMGPSSEPTVGFALRPVLVDGSRYDVSLVAFDMQGRRYEASRSFVADVQKPEISSLPDAQQYVNVAGRALSWTVEDAVSGIREAYVERSYGMGWTRVAAVPIELAPSRTLEAFLDPVAEGVPEGATVRYRLTAVDGAGNLVQHNVTALFDKTRPVVRAVFTDRDANGLTSAPYLDWHVQIWDNGSGLQATGALVEDDQGGVVSERAGEAHAGARYVQWRGNESEPTLHQLYLLKAYARDRAGNELDWTGVNLTAYEIYPEIVRTMPRFAESAWVGDVELRLDAIVPGRPELVPDWLNVTVSNATATRTLASTTTGAVAQLVDLAGLRGEYTLNVTAVHGRARVQTLETVLLRPPEDAPLERLDTLRVLDGPSDADVFWLDHGGNCDPTRFTLSAVSPSGRTLWVYLAQGAPATVGTDPSSFPHQDTSTGSAKTLVQDPAVQGARYTVMVRSPDPGPTGYFLRWGTPECAEHNGGKAVEPPREMVPGNLDDIKLD